MSDKKGEKNLPTEKKILKETENNSEKKVSKEESKTNNEEKKEIKKKSPEFIFNEEKKFLIQMKEVVKERNIRLRIYITTMEKIGNKYNEQMDKYNNGFSQFLKENKNAILSSKSNDMKSWNINCSKKVKLDVKEIYNLLEQKEQITFWHYLQQLYILHFPENEETSDIIEKLKKIGEVPDGSNEMKAFQDIIKKTSEIVKDDGVNLSEGDFGGLISSISSGFQSGNLDIGRMLGVLSVFAKSIDKKEADIKND